MHKFGGDAMQHFAVSYLLALFLGGLSTLLAQPAFIRSDVIVGVGPQAVVAGDFNRDRKPDLAVVTGEGLFTFLNRGYTDMPGPGPVRTEGVSGSDLLTGFYAPFVGVEDFNGDGLDELVSNGVLLLGNGDGTFRVARRDLAVVVGIGDFNGDGKVDLLQSDIFPGAYLQGLRVLLGNGDRTFRPGATITTVILGPVGQVLVADVNRDGRPDVASSVLSGTLLVFLGQGDGAFGSAIPTQMPVVPFWMYLAADFNGDGIPDLTTPFGIALGKGEGTFQPPVPYPQGVGFPIAAADFTGDGRVDLVTTNLSNSISVFPGKGDGTLLPPRQQSVGWGVMPSGAVVNLEYPDCCLDLVTVNGSSNSISLLRNYWSFQQPMTLQRAVSAASGTAIVAPGSLATLYGPTSATGNLTATPHWPTRLGGISLEILDDSGMRRLAPLLYVSPTQINFQVPSDLSMLGFANFAIVDDRGRTDAGALEMDPVAPGLFQVIPAPYGPPAATAVRVEPGGTQVSIPVYTCASSATGLSCDLSPIPLSTAGDRPIYLSFFGTGFHGATSANVTCEINGVQVPVVYAGPQEMPGVDQINVQLSPKVLDGYFGETMPVLIRIDGVPANSTLIAVR
jgi:uncharacterized protein (TIGR03437 family)